MEKVVVATGNYPLSNEDMYEVNRYLGRGWSVKSVTTQNTKDHMTVIFVLEREGTPSLTGTYRSNPGWNGDTDYLALDENGAYVASFYGGGRGLWKVEGNSVVLIPDDKSPICKYEIGNDGMSIVIGGRVFSLQTKN